MAVSLPTRALPHRADTVGVQPSLLESWFPSLELSMLAQADKRADDPVYATHRWWARRPPAVFRAMLIASVLPATVRAEEFWAIFRDSDDLLDDVRVHDPFVGGGTTLIEAARLGATLSGSDVDPLAVEISSLSLERGEPAALRAAGFALTTFVQSRTEGFWPSGDGATPLHYFFLHTVVCPSCGSAAPLYRDLMIARWSGAHGAVRRDTAVTAFCPSCFHLQDLDLDSSALTCCGETRSLSGGNFRGQRFHCPTCGETSTHAQLQTGKAPRRLIAIEETRAAGYRQIRAPSSLDEDAIQAASRWVVANRGDLDLPSGSFATPRLDERPVSYGMTRYEECFTDRQLAMFGLAFRWIAEADVDRSVRRALVLAVSSALSTNNRLCGYARDYGRLAPLFSIRGYALPAMPVELNPLHPAGGRGTLRTAIRRMVRASEGSGRRYHWDTVTGAPSSGPVVELCRSDARIISASAADPDAYPSDGVDLVIFDPPYFDYIAYNELSEFYRAWIGGMPLGGTSLHPDSARPVESFADYLASCLVRAAAARQSRTPISFTYHSAHEPAWEALGLSLDKAKWAVTGIWPVRNDVHMGLHTFAGNCEWDVVVVCRPTVECVTEGAPPQLQDWLTTLAPLVVSEADHRNLSHALAMAAKRWAVVDPQQERTR